MKLGDAIEEVVRSLMSSRLRIKYKQTISKYTDKDLRVLWGLTKKVSGIAFV